MEELIQLKASFDAQEWAMPNWTDKVLAHLQDNEVAKDQNDKKYPRVRGLRRIGSYLSGALIECEPLKYENGYAACIATARKLQSDTLNHIVATSTAEATPENVNNDAISKHLLATAESRAEGRCWTKVLKLNCLTAEELSVSESSNKTIPDVTVNIDDVNKEDHWFNEVQRKMLNKKCKSLNLNVLGLAEYMRKEKEFDNTHIDKNSISKSLAFKMIEELDKSIKKEKGCIKFEEKTELQGYESI